MQLPRDTDLILMSHIRIVAGGEGDPPRKCFSNIMYSNRKILMFDGIFIESVRDGAIELSLPV